MYPFDGLRVLDFSWVAAGPLVTKHLADYGATVVRIESTTRPDTLRTSNPYKDAVPGINRSGYYAYWNANKMSMALNLNHPKGVEIAKRLVSWADIVVENFTPGTMAKWGLSYKDLVKLKPELLMLSLSMHGQEGQYAKHSGVGPVLSGLVGIISLTGWPDREPVQAAGGTDMLAADLALTTLISALIYRSRTGEGQYIDLSQGEATLYALTPLILDYAVNGEAGKQMGNSSPFGAPHGAYRCKGDDRWCAIAVLTDEEWAAFCRVIGLPMLINEPRFITTRKRKENEDELNKLVANWTANFTPEEAVDLMQKSGIAAGVLETAEDMLKDPQLKFRDAFWLMEHHEMGPCYHLGQSFVLSEFPPNPRLPAPLLGEHTEYVCREILGMTDEEFVELFNEGVFT